MGGCQGVKVKKLFMQIHHFSRLFLKFAFFILSRVSFCQIHSVIWSKVGNAFQDCHGVRVLLQALIVLTDLTLGPPHHTLSVHFSRSSTGAQAVSLHLAWAILYVYISSRRIHSCLDFGSILFIGLSSCLQLVSCCFGPLRYMLDWIHHLPLSGPAEGSSYQHPALLRYVGLAPCLGCAHLQLPAPLCSTSAVVVPWCQKDLSSFLQKF